MAHTFVFAIAGQVLGKLSAPIFQELSLAWGLNEEIHKLENTVSSIRAVLLDAQDRQASSNQLKDWIGKLDDALFRAQNVLEDFEINALRYKVHDRTTLRKVHREILSHSNRIIFRFKMVHRIMKLREEFDMIAADRIKYNLVERIEERVVTHKGVTHSFLPEDDVIGRHEQIEDVLRFLLVENNNEKLPVLPIIGLGGIGKTTVAKMVYKDERVVKHFDLRIWVCISEDFGLENVIKEILRSLEVKDSDSLRLEQLQKCLRERLGNRKYLLVLDDVWNESRNKWIELRNLLIVGATGSRIITTTRNQSVALIMATTDRSIEIQVLSNEECLILFSKCAFRSREDVSKHPKLVEIAEQIVKKCKGVPLAVRTLGSMLYHKTDEQEWIDVRDNEIWKIEQNEGDILPALELSYYQLPTNLRRCFSFCSIFPKDHKFYSDNLVMMWRANGLLQTLDNIQDSEDIGVKYVKQLMSRGFFQELTDYGSCVAFKMHDLVHDLALQVAERNCFNMNCQEARYCHSNRSIRHISFPRDCFSTEKIPNWLLAQKKNVCTIIFPYGVGFSNDSFANTCISKFKLLRHLDLHESNFEVLPSSIGSLNHLKFLNLTSNMQLKTLPRSICKLVGLETLFFAGCTNIEKLPKGFGKLVHLRHLGITTKESYFPEDEMKCLTSLRHLDISHCPNLKFLMSDNVIRCLSSLRTLSVLWCDNLVCLPIVGFRHLTLLETLCITDCRSLNFTMNSKTTNTVGDGLCSLQLLVASNLPKLETWPISLFHGAKKLKVISISRLDNLTKLFPEHLMKNLRSLERIWIGSCPKVTSLPKELHSFTHLKEIKIWSCPELVKRCQRRIGTDWYKISHVPHVCLDGIKI